MALSHLLRLSRPSLLSGQFNISHICHASLIFTSLSHLLRLSRLSHLSCLFHISYIYHASHIFTFLSHLLGLSSLSHLSLPVTSLTLWAYPGLSHFSFLPYISQVSRLFTYTTILQLQDMMKACERLVL